MRLISSVTRQALYWSVLLSVLAFAGATLAPSYAQAASTHASKQEVSKKKAGASKKAAYKKRKAVHARKKVTRPASSQARLRAARRAPVAYATGAPGFEAKKYAAYVIEPATGRVLVDRNSTSPRYPASLTKMMTLYLLFDALHRGQLTLDQSIAFSAHAASMPQTNLFTAPGDRIDIRTAIRALVVRSANDVAVAVGERISGSEIRFAQLMNSRARALGMNDTHFENASGLPNPRQRTTARDMATLAIALKRDFPQYYPYFRTLSFAYGGRTFVTHNSVVQKYAGADGLKTGFIGVSGFNVATSAERGGKRLVAVVMGGPSAAARDRHMMALLDDGFRGRVTASQLASVAPSAGAAHTATSPSPSPRADGVPAALARAPHPAAQSGWGIQIGAFGAKHEAQEALQRAVRTVPNPLRHASVNVAQAGSNAAVHRARLENLTETQARNACRSLQARRKDCFVYQVN